MTALQSMPLAALRQLAAQTTDNDLVGDTTQPTPNPLLAALGQGAAPPNQPSVGAAPWMNQQSAVQALSQPTPGTSRILPPTAPGPVGLSPTGSGPSPAQLSAVGPLAGGLPPSLPSSSVDPALAQATAIGSPNNPLAVRMKAAFDREQAGAQGASELKQAAMGLDPLSGKPMISGQYDPQRPGPYGFDEGSLAGNLPTVDREQAAALTQKSRDSNNNFLNPDFARRFAGGGPVIDDRGPLTKSFTDGSNVALPSYRIKGVDQMSKAEIEALPPDLRRAAFDRDAKRHEEQALEDKNLAKVSGDHQSGALKHWHGGVNMTDSDWGAARARQAADDDERGAKRQDRANKRHERDAQLSQSLAENTANNPLAGIDPEWFKWQDPETKAGIIHSALQSQEGRLNRATEIEKTKIQAGHNDPRWTSEKKMKEGENAINLAKAKLADPTTPEHEKPFWQNVLSQGAQASVGPINITPPAAPPQQSSPFWDDFKRGLGRWGKIMHPVTDNDHPVHQM